MQINSATIKLKKPKNLNKIECNNIPDKGIGMFFKPLMSLSKDWLKIISDRYFI